MNKLLRYLLLICVVVLCGGASYGQVPVTFMVKSKTSVTADPVLAGVTASFNNNGTNNNDQMTSGKSMTLTVKGYQYAVKQIKLKLRRNSGGGAGTLDVKIGTTSVLNQTLSKNSLTSTYTEYAYDLTKSGNEGEDIVITLKASANSLYCNSFTIVPKTGKESTALSFGKENDNKTFDLTVGDYFAAPTATLTPAVEGAKITYSSDKPEVATVDASTGTVTLRTTEGTAVITASYAGNDKYEASTVSYTINLTKPFEVEDGVFDFTESCDYGSGLTPTNDNNAENATSSKWIAKNVSFETSGGKGVRWWINGSVNELRVYGNTKFKISVPEGNFITLIHIDGVNSGFSVDSGTFKGGKWSGCSQTVVFTNGNTRKDIKKITVKYIAKESVTPTTNGYATFACSYPVNYSENRLKAYTIKVDEDNQKVAYTEFTGVVPEGMAVLVSGTEGQKYELAPATEKADATFATDLTVSDGTVKSDGTNFYGFTTKDGVSGFVRVAKDVAVPQGKGYLQLTGNTAAAPVFYSINIGGGTTGIGQVEVEKGTENGAIYNLAGQRVDASYKGVVIKNGKKYVNK